MIKPSVLLLAIAGLPFTFINPCSEHVPRQVAEAPQGAQVFAVEVVEPQFITTPSTHLVDGEFEESEINFVTANFAGKVDGLYVNEGDKVRENDPVVSLSNTDLLDDDEIKHAKAKELSARLKSVKNKLLASPNPEVHVSTEDVSFLDEEPAPPKSNTMPSGPAETEPPQTLRDLADLLQTMVDRTNAEANALDKKLLELHQKSSVVGTVVQRFVSEGDHIKEGDKLMAIAKTDPMSVVFHLPKDEASFVDKHSTVHVTPVDAPVVEGDGQVYFIAPDIDPVNQAIEVRAHVTNPDGRMKGGQKANIKVATTKTERVLMLPEKTLVSEGNKKFIFVVFGNRVQLQEIHLGRKLDNDTYEILGADLRMDDPIVVNHPPELKNNSFVKVIDPKLLLKTESASPDSDLIPKDLTPKDSAKPNPADEQSEEKRMQDEMQDDQ